MAMSDPIADMLTRVRNAGKAKFNSVNIPGSKMKYELAKLLKDEGYIRNYKFNFDINDSYDSSPPGEDANNNNITVVTSIGYTF